MEPDKIKEKAPDMGAAFERARTGKEEKKREVSKPMLELKPPTLSPPGMGGPVSPQLQIHTREEIRKQLRLAREFRTAARDGFER